MTKHKLHRIIIVIQIFVLLLFLGALIYLPWATRMISAIKPIMYQVPIIFMGILLMLATIELIAYKAYIRIAYVFIGLIAFINIGAIYIYMYRFLAVGIVIYLFMIYFTVCKNYFIPSKINSQNL